MREYLDAPESHYQGFSGSMVRRCYNDEDHSACSFRTDFKVCLQFLCFKTKNLLSFSFLLQNVLHDVGITPPPCVMIWCCNNFLVHKSRILAHPLSHYERLLDFTMSSREGEAGWKHSCFYLEHTWHLLFGEPAEMYFPTKDTILNGDCMVDGNDYVSNPARPNPLHLSPYVWLKHSSRGN
jgi:hypothetical protein